MKGECGSKTEFFHFAPVVGCGWLAGWLEEAMDLPIEIDTGEKWLKVTGGQGAKKE